VGGGAGGGVGEGCAFAGKGNLGSELIILGGTFGLRKGIRESKY
jgi:hypothetical protein